jgi:Flp pilus assembly protein TadG
MKRTRSTAILSSMRMFLRESAGQNLVEFALVIVLVMALLVGVVEFGRAWNIYQVIANGAREGARIAALPVGFATAADVNTRVDNYLNAAGLPPGSTTVAIGGAGIDGGTGTQVSVTVSHPYQFLYVGPIVRLINPAATAGGAVTLQAQAIMRNE